MRAPRLSLAAVAAACLLTSSPAFPQSGVFDRFGTPAPPQTAQDRAERERARDALSERLEPEYRTSAPYVSRTTIEATRQAIDRYRGLADMRDWVRMPAGVTLRPGDTGDYVALVKRKLVITGDMRRESAGGFEFDAALQEGLGRFQMRHGLRVTGFVDSSTREALSVSPGERFKQLLVNLDRIDGLMRINEADRYVLVNVPAYTLQAVSGGRLELDSRVVVGKPARETPEVSARILELNFYPYWRVPDSIARKDLIPKIRKEPNYFADEHFSVLRAWGAEPLDKSRIDWSSSDVTSYKFRQDPGPWNALGLVRINMPNSHDVYLHDTPLKRLFSQSSRAFSSGCVRVQGVFDLADWLIQAQSGWDPSRVKELVQNGQPETIKLKKPVPVHFVYITAWANENGTINFRPDIYGRDGARGEAGDDEGATVAEKTAVTP